jgi:hypothetical protein
VQFTQQEEAAMQALRFIETYVIEASDQKDLVAAGKTPLVFVIFTGKSFHSASRLMQMELVYKYAH